MRTLKKTLCLVLCLAMMAGLCCIAASADYADFTDEAEITHKEAVAVLTGIGVINGMTETTFAPEGTLTRAQAAKIICCLLNAGDIKATCNFDDCQGHWAANYIAYCAAKGIVNGVGDNKFAPEAKLTGSAWAKMLLVAVGYNAENEGMTGADWEVGVATLVKSLKLAAGIEGFDATAEISRDDACQMAFTALTELYTVKYASSGVTIKTDDVEITAGASKAEETTEKLADAFALTETTDTAADDAYGRPTTKQWTAGEGKAAKVVYEESYAADFTYVVEKYLTAEDAEKTVIAAYAKEAGVKASDVVVDWSDALAPGYVVEFAAVKDGKNTVLVPLTAYIYVFDKIESVKATKVKDADYTYDIKTEWYEAELKDTDLPFAVAEGDVLAVPFCFATNEPILDDAVKATAKTGFVTSTAKDMSYITVGGQKLALNFEDMSIFGDSFFDFDELFDTEFIYYVNPMGAVLGAFEVKTEATPDTTIAYAVAFQAKAAGSGDAGTTDLFGTTGAKEATDAKALLIVLNQDGTQETLNIAIEKDEKDGKYYFVGSDEEVTDIGPDYDNCTYAVEYYLTEKGDAVIVGGTSSLGIETAKGAQKVAVDGYDENTNSSTVLNVFTYALDKKDNPDFSKVTVASYKGYKNFPAVSGYGYVTYDKAGTYVTEINVFVVAAAPAPEKAPVAALVKVGDYEKDGYPTTFLVNGEEVTYYYGTELDGLFYELTVKSGKLTGADEIDASEYDVYSVADVDEGNFFMSTDGDVVEFVKDTAVYDISGDELDLAKGVDVAVFKTVDEKGVVTSLVIFVLGETEEMPPMPMPTGMPII